MESIDPDNTDAALHGLGPVPTNIETLVERHAGQARWSLEDADAALSRLSEELPIAREAAPLRPPASANRSSESEFGGDRRQVQAGQPPFGAVSDAAASSKGLGAAAQPEAEVETRAVRLGRVEPSTAAENPDARSTPVAVTNAESSSGYGTSAPESSLQESQSDSDGDSFEILVDEEVLEIEADDLVVEDAGEESDP